MIKQTHYHAFSCFPIIPFWCFVKHHLHCISSRYPLVPPADVLSRFWCATTALVSTGGQFFFLPTCQIVTVCEACVCVSLSDVTGTPEELILSWDSDQFLMCFREITPAFNIISLWIICVMFDGVFNTFLYEKFYIFSYMDEYNIIYYNFISLGQTFNFGWNFSSCFLNRGAFAIIRIGHVILCGDSMLWNWKLWKQNVKDSCIDARCYYSRLRIDYSRCSYDMSACLLV